MVTGYKSNQHDPAAQRNVGLIALLVGVSEWGVSGQDLPPDPAKREWRSNSSATQGKHLMSYDMGGIGISHCDSDELGRYVKFVVDQWVDPGYRERFLRFANVELYHLVPPSHHKGIMYDQIRSSGLCVSQEKRVHVDLDGKPFAEAGHLVPSDTQCGQWKNQNFTVEDWQLFRHYMRVALWTEQGQEWLIESWLDHNWTASVKAVFGASGAMDEALANARVRNSSPAAAQHAVKRPAGTATQNIQREIDAYTHFKQKTSARRCVYIWRSVALFRHLMGWTPIGVLKCPSER